MLELLLMQAAPLPPAAAAFGASAAAGLFEAAVDAADAGWRRSAVKAEAVKEEAETDEDAEFDLFFETLPLSTTTTTTTPDFLAGDAVDISVCSGVVIDDADDLLKELLLLGGDCPMPEAAASPPTLSIDEDADDDAGDGNLSSSPASFEPTMSPTSPTPSSSVSPSSRPASGGGGRGGRVSKPKREANREAAYRYRLKQRIDDSATDQRRAELQSAADELAGRVSAVESEARFLVAMCRQIFTSRRRLQQQQQK